MDLSKTTVDSLPSTPAWLLTGQNGTESLEFDAEFPLPPLGPHDVLVRIHAASLNYRDLAIAQGKFNLPLAPPKTPLSDGAGVVLQTGTLVTRFVPGNEIVTHLTTNSKYDEMATYASIGSGLGQGVHGTLRKYAVFHESALLKVGRLGLGYREAATLTCSGLTAWNALFGWDGLLNGPDEDESESEADANGEVNGNSKNKSTRDLTGQTVLVQGTGGVSIAALQFALAANATIIATTSSSTKAQKLKSLGAHHIINYRDEPSWGALAKSLTPDSRGVDIIIDVGGSSTIAESLKAARIDGMIALTGLLGGAAQPEDPSIMAGLMYLVRTRGVLLGSRRQFAEMNGFIEEKGIKPVYDEKVFGFEEAKEAFKFLEQQRHFSKVVIDVEYDEGI
ncbi:zinc-dependent alcohol dehydrogenase family protein [Aspergillus stella-maris]|uniref:zinc-dependent alcohol dehydrogenase family protein n=1 Tax=Aspergillus stella-maris TaxID=1810926 RepID=UPI003CCDF1A0